VDRAKTWDDIPLCLSVADLQRCFSLSKHQSYTVANLIGIRLGKRLIIPKERFRSWLETGSYEANPTTLWKPVEKHWGGHSLPAPAAQLRERWEVTNSARTR
jgi:hypothetical protein